MKLNLILSSFAPFRGLRSNCSYATNPLLLLAASSIIYLFYLLLIILFSLGFNFVSGAFKTCTQFLNIFFNLFKKSIIDAIERRHF